MGASYLTATVTMGLLSFHSPSAEWSSYIENKTKQQQQKSPKETNKPKPRWSQGELVVCTTFYRIKGLIKVCKYNCILLKQRLIKEEKWYQVLQLHGLLVEMVLRSRDQ